MKKKKKQKEKSKISWSTRGLVNALLIGAVLATALEWIIYEFKLDREYHPFVLIGLLVLFFLWRVIEFVRPYRNISFFVDSSESIREPKLAKQDIDAQQFRASDPKKQGPQSIVKQNVQAKPKSARMDSAISVAGSQNNAAGASNPKRKKEEPAEAFVTVTCEDLKALVADDITSKIVETTDGSTPQLKYIDREETAFHKTHHPMLQRFSRDTARSAGQISGYLFLYRPYSYTVTQNHLKLDFDLGSARAGYFENRDQIAFRRTETYSWHDGGGGSWEYFLLSVASGVVKPDKLENASEHDGLALPKNTGFWFGEDDTLYIANPFGLDGIFELVYNKQYQNSTDDERTIQTLGNTKKLGLRIRQVEKNGSIEESIHEMLGDKVYTLDYLKRWECHTAEDYRKPQYAKYDQSLDTWRLTVQLDIERVWFLSVFVKGNGTFDKYSLDCELADDSHYEFTDEKAIRRRLYHPGDEALHFAEVLIRYVQRYGGNSLLSEIYPYVTTEYHFD